MYLLLDLDGQLVGLLALDAQSGDGQHQVTVFQNLSPLQGRVDLMGSNTSDGSQKLSNVRTVDVDLVVSRESGSLLDLRDLRQTQRLERRSEILHDGGFGVCELGS